MLVATIGVGAAAIIEITSSSSHGAQPAPAGAAVTTPSATSPPTTQPPTSKTVPEAVPETVPETVSETTLAEPAPTDAELRLERLRALEGDIRWRRSRALGQPSDGRLVNGVMLPSEGEHFFTWDGPNRRSPSPDWRRWGTDRLVRLVLQVARDFAAAHPDAPRLAIGDLSRPNGGSFGREFGGRGHASHQNGLDVDIFYPRTDRLERPPHRPAAIDRALAQDLVGRFVRAGARFVFVGPATGLHGPARIVQPLRNHDDHLHVRLHPA